MTAAQGYQGTQSPTSGGTDYNTMAFVSKAMINGMATATLVQVRGVHNTGGLAPVGLVDIQPLINQTDGYGNAIPHSIIYNCPYLRIQGGGNAVIIDPVVGDTGIAIFCDKDISKLIANQVTNSGATSSPANPDSNRRFSFSDGLYLGGVLNGTPTQYVQFNASGITVTSPTAVIVNAPHITMNAATAVAVTTPTMTVNGALNVTGNVTGAGISLTTHVHSGVITGSDDTGLPH